MSGIAEHLQQTVEFLEAEKTELTARLEKVQAALDATTNALADYRVDTPANKQLAAGPRRRRRRAATAKPAAAKSSKAKSKPSQRAAAKTSKASSNGTASTERILKAARQLNRFTAKDLAERAEVHPTYARGWIATQIGSGSVTITDEVLAGRRGKPAKIYAIT